MSKRASGSLSPDHPLFAPGLIRRARDGREALYWVPPQKDVKAGYRPRSITLQDHLPDEDIAFQCRRMWADLTIWRTPRENGPTRYSIAWLIDRYLKDEASPYQNLGHRAQRSYASFCKIIREGIGERRLDPDRGTPRILGEDVRRWHKLWGRPDKTGAVTTPSRARHLIVQFRLLTSYAVELGVPGARDLRDMLSAMRFPMTEARTIAPTREQVMALADKAKEMARPSIAGVSLAQFLFMERRTHIIGAYVNKQWRPGWNWSDISDDWMITYYQTKNDRTERTFDLKIVPALLAILQATPKDQRIGAVFKDEKTGDPWRERHYADVFREIADAAKWPAELKSMDLRAGAATEADAIEVSDRQLQDAGGWKDSRTKDRYRRAPQRNAQNVVELRQKARGENQG